MRNRCYIATFSENALEVIRENHLNIELDHLCISENLDHPEKTLLEMQKDMEISQAKGAIIHGPYTELNPSSIDPKAIELTMLRYQQAYAICKDIQIPKMVVHSGFIPKAYYPGWHTEKSILFWKRFLEDKSADFHLYIENVFEAEPFMLRDIIDGIGDDRVQICLDVGHANASSDGRYDVYDWIQELGDRIGHVHLHNNQGEQDEHAPVFQGSMDMREVISRLEQACEGKVTYTIESRTCKDSVEWLEENISDF